MSQTKIIEDKLTVVKAEYDEALKILSSLQNDIRNTEARAWGLQGAMQVLQATLEETSAATVETTTGTTEEKTPTRPGLSTAKARK